MRLESSLLASRGEKKLYEALRTTFAGEKGYFLPQVKYSELIDATRSEIKELASSKWDCFGWYLQTSVDLTFCLGDLAEPLFSIEFDGLGGGFSKDGRYQPRRKTHDARRSEKLDLKVRMAEHVGYPLIVIADDELRPVAEDQAWLLADGIAARLLAWLSEGDHFTRVAREEGVDSTSITDDEETMLWHRAADEASALVDPFERGVDAIRTALPAVCRPTLEQEELRRLYRPPAPDPREDTQGYFEAVKGAKEVGAEVTIGVPPVRVQRSVWMRNLVLPANRDELTSVPDWMLTSPTATISGPRIAEEVTERVARYLAYLELWDRCGGPEGSN